MLIFIFCALSIFWLVSVVERIVVLVMNMGFSIVRGMIFLFGSIF